MESGLVNLKAELHKKKSEANKLQADHHISNRKLKPIIKESKNVKKQSNSKLQICSNDDEDSLKLEKSKNALEKKAALYDKIKGGIEVLDDDELNQKFLINFQEKIHEEVSSAKEKREVKKIANSQDKESYKAKNSTEEWTEYTDSLGRTRICQQKDLDYFKKQDESFQGTVSSPPKPENKFHSRWDRVEEETAKKDNVHYEDVLFDEARAHGTGFMQFSRDEEERAAQLQLLKDLDAETAKATLSKESLRRKRQKAMQERLGKVRQKKRLKMGLPMQGDDKLKTPPPSDEEEEDDQDTAAAAADADADAVDTASEATSDVTATEKKPSHIREWDLGKAGVSATMSQEQWIEAKRKARQEEFAPPLAYQPDSEPWRERGKALNPRAKEEEEEIPRAEEEERRRAGPEFAPPSSYDYYNSTSTRRNFSLGRRVDIESAISRGLSELRRNFDTKKE